MGKARPRSEKGHREAPETADSGKLLSCKTDHEQRLLWRWKSLPGGFLVTRGRVDGLLSIYSICSHEREQWALRDGRLRAR